MAKAKTMIVEPVAPLWAQLVGWYGAIAILAAYALLSLQMLGSQSLWYQGLNLTGAVGLMIVSWYEKVYQNVFLNLVWLFVAIYALMQLI